MTYCWSIWTGARRTAASPLGDGAERLGCLLLSGGEAAAAAIRDCSRPVVLVGTASGPLASANSRELGRADAAENQTAAQPAAFRLALLALHGESESEPLPNAAKLEQRLGAPVLRLYGLGDFALPLAGECDARDGLHIIEDQFLVEVLDAPARRCRMARPARLSSRHCYAKPRRCCASRPLTAARSPMPRARAVAPACACCPRDAPVAPLRPKSGQDVGRMALDRHPMSCLHLGRHRCRCRNNLVGPPRPAAGDGDECASH